MLGRRPSVGFDASADTEEAGIRNCHASIGLALLISHCAWMLTEKGSTA